MNTNRNAIFRLLITTFFLISLSSCSQSPEEKLIGEWKGNDDTGKSASLVFNADRSARMIQGNMVLDGSSLGGKVTWELDASHDPMHLDLVMTMTSGDTKRLPFIVRLLGDKILQARIGEDSSKRPIAFSENKDINQIILERQ